MPGGELLERAPSPAGSIAARISCAFSSTAALKRSIFEGK